MLLNKHTRTIIIGLAILGCLITTQVNCSLSESKSEIMTNYGYARALFVDVKDSFNNEALNEPYKIRMNPATGEIVLLDQGNVCFYVFSPDGKFVRKIGDKGQGPGEFLRPRYFDFDTEGNIYTYDFVNKRVMIVSKTGQYVSSFRVSIGKSRHIYFNLFVTPEKEIVMNIPENGYYITVFSKDGEKIKDIGLIEGMEDYRPMIKQKFSEGFVFKIDKQYYIFLEKLFAVKVFDEMGNMTQEVKLEVVNNEFKELKEQLFTPPDSPNHPPNGVKSARYMQEVIYRNGNFYILTFDVFAEREKTFPIFVLGKDFKFLNKIVLELKEPTKIGLESTGFEVLNDENRILYPIKNEAKVYEFRK